MKTYEECLDDPVYCVIEESTIQSINDYVTRGFDPGGFVTAVLANDLMSALGRADMENRLTIWVICNYVYNEIGASLHGSYDAVRNHINEIHERISSD